MESNGSSFLPIKKSELTDKQRGAANLLNRVSWHPKVSKSRASKAGNETAQEIIRTLSAKTSAESISVVDKARKISDDSLLVFDDNVSFCLDTLRRGIAIGMHSANLYSKASNFHTLIEQQKRGELKNHPEALTEFREKHTTTSAIVMFVAASYIVSKLSNYKTEEIDSVKVRFEGIPEDLHLANFTHALNYMMYYYGYFVSDETIRNSTDFVKMTLVYFKEILSEIDFVKDSFKHAEAFTNKGYKLEDEDFTIQGFEVHNSIGVQSVELNRIDWKDIVGNTLYKHSSKRTIQFMMCYDKERQQNPVNEIGGFPGITMEYGPAGTGKSMGICATATELSDRCKDLDIPFLYHPIPQTMVSTYQGGSAENIKRWFGPMDNPNMIVYAPIDDGDGKLRDRGSKNTSSGVIEVVEGFLVNTEGASASKRGNRVIQIYTNLPETLDKAVLSRVQKRSILEGAVTVEDFLDQDYIWWKAYNEMVPDFINMEDPLKYTYMSAQDITKNISEKLAEFSESKVYKIQQIIENTLKEYKSSEHKFFAKLYENVKKEFPLFTSRDVRNIQSAVNTRLTDFDFPDEWMRDHAVFYSLSYEKKLEMLKEKMKENMEGLNFHEIRLQEVIRYLDNMAMIVDKDFEAKVAEVVANAKINNEAGRRLKI